MSSNADYLSFKQFLKDNNCYDQFTIKCADECIETEDELAWSSQE